MITFIIVRLSCKYEMFGDALENLFEEFITIF